MNLARTQWLSRLDRVARPVLEALSLGQLRSRMPVEHHPNSSDRANYTHLEAVGRLLCGMTPWLELDPSLLSGDEQTLHDAYRQLVRAGIAMAVDPESADFCNFSQGQQPIVDAAFLAHALLRAPKFTRTLDRTTLDHLINAFKATRSRKPGFCNWLLFSAMIESALYELTGECDLMRIDYAVRQHEQWYIGDGTYSDGPAYHADFYNSYVIQPMLIDVLRTTMHMDAGWQAMFPAILKRGKRFAEIQERTIMPDGSFPPIGRSIAYRCGAFQHLAQMALQQTLPDSLKPAQVRGALTLVIQKTLDADGTFDANGWLQIGLCGHQPGAAETYISTGSLYLCAAAFLPLGLPPTDAFWSDADVPTTTLIAWSGGAIHADHAL